MALIAAHFSYRCFIQGVLALLFFSRENCEKRPLKQRVTQVRASRHCILRLPTVSTSVVHLQTERWPSDKVSASGFEGLCRRNPIPMETVVWWAPLSQIILWGTNVSPVEAWN
ncbi:hypothetical protein AVEN_165827-1 [Araneus ventricosus]|uniref:Secreted protein n=1 Tax=Araneus ventricosus TaxID=182803 RepID=A0A4Y2EMY2_ARAVE|nr:hypothetical protein AVEN_165827-1 [Araneus ventricosus]